MRKIRNLEIQIPDFFEKSGISPQLAMRRAQQLAMRRAQRFQS
jgi:hypothetical protein